MPKSMAMSLMAVEQVVDPGSRADSSCPGARVGDDSNYVRLLHAAHVEVGEMPVLHVGDEIMPPRCSPHVAPASAAWAAKLHAGPA